MSIKWYSDKDKNYFYTVKDLDNYNINEINPIFIRLYYLTDREEVILKKMLFNVLKHINRVYLNNSLYTVLRESILNGVKANIKRLFFINKKLNINDPNQYQKGMSIFKDEVDLNRKRYISELKQQNKYVVVKIMFNKDYLIVGIKNNSIIKLEEEKKIKEALEKSKDFTNVADLFTMESDDIEGDGLGIPISTILLKNEGITVSESFLINKDNIGTTFLIKISLSLKRKQTAFIIAKKIADEIKELPTFDENIQKLQNIINHPETTIKRIARLVMADISITSSLLKLVNSAAFSLQNKIVDVEDAIKMVGLKELNNLLYTIGTKKIMEGKYAFFEEIWETSNECAFVAILLSKRKKINKYVENNIIVSGLLHDIGNVILLSLEEETVRSVMKIADIKNKQPNLMLEESVLGLSHTTVGNFIAKKWKFPNEIREAIEKHHTPDFLEEDANEDIKIIIYSIYLADRIVEFNQGSNNFETLYKKCVEFFNLDSKEKYEEFAKKSKKEYIKYTFLNY